MREELELQLEKDFPFMKRNRSEDETNIYKRWGCECSSGWYMLIHELCRAIAERYAEENEPADIVVLQVKEKLAVLRFYYTYKEPVCSDERIEKLRDDIFNIVRKFQDESASVCERCGKKGRIRADLPWKRTLCECCYDNVIKQIKHKTTADGSLYSDVK